MVFDCCLDVDVDGDGDDDDDDGEDASCLLSTLYTSHQGINILTRTPNNVNRP